jgi:SAM-dependent methyltransferase
LDRIGAAGEEAIRGLRDEAGWMDRQLLHRGPELLDREDTPASVKRAILGDVERLTKMLQLHRLWRWRVGKMIVEARRTRRGKPVRVLDVGAGGGGLLFRIGDWAQRRRIPVELHGIDQEERAIEGARRMAAEEGRRVELRTGDARALPYEAGAMDVVVTTFMLHHLPAGDVARVLHEIDRVAAVNFFAFDLRRNVPALPALWALLRVGGFDAPTRHDSIVSLRKGYTVEEIDALAKSAGIPSFTVERLPTAFYALTRG